MKKGFTLLELIVVIIILGVLATLGLGQYTRVIERSRGAEARVILGTVRTGAAGFFLERSDLTGLLPAQVGIGTGTDQIPSTCRATNYFSYAFVVTAGTPSTGFTATATRCIAGGKTPNAPDALNLTLITNFATGADTWGGDGGY